MPVGGVDRMDKGAAVRRAKRIGTGLCLIAFPLVFVFAFSVHPGLMNPHLLGPEQLILRAHNAGLLQFAHVLVLLATTLLVVAAVHFMKVLENTSWAWAGLVGAAVGVVGAIILAADKGALCLTMTAIDTLPADKFAEMMPGLIAMFSFKGSMWLLWGMALLSVGFALLAVALFATRAIPRWQSALFLVGVLFVGFPDGVEIINLTASILMAVALVPYGIRMLAEQGQSGRAAGAVGDLSAMQRAHPEGGVEPRPASVAACTGCRRRLAVAGCVRGE